MRGGKRDNAGRKKGDITKATAIRQEMLARAAAEGISPLEFMLTVLRDDTKPFTDRFEAAKASAPYVHPRLAAVEHSGNQEKPVAYSVISGVTRVTDTIDDSGTEHLNGNGHASH